MDLKKLLPYAIQAAEKASEEILKVYHSEDFSVEAKADDSPLTIADKRAHHIIAEALQSTGLPVLSEEGKHIPYEVRRHWEYFWMVDPLDGTKEFIKRNGEFTVNIALIHRQTAVLGVVAIPVKQQIYFGGNGMGAFLRTSGKDIALARRTPVNFNKEGLRVVASRSHMNTETESFIDNLLNPSLVSAGSSLKFMLLASGQADVYPRFAPTMEWDTAAAHAICEAVGLKVVQKVTQQSVIYNKPDLLNPSFLVY